MKEEDIRLIKQEIKNNRIAGECGLASNNEKFEWTKTADALEKLLDYITNLQEEKEMYKKEKDTLMNSLFITRNKYNNDKARYIRKSKNYKTRIYKAIKLLKDIKYDLDIEPWSIYQVKGNILFDLLKILKGSDE